MAKIGDDSKGLRVESRALLRLIRIGCREISPFAWDGAFFPIGLSQGHPGAQWVLQCGLSAGGRNGLVPHAVFRCRDEPLGPAPRRIKPPIGQDRSQVTFETTQLPNRRRVVVGRVDRIRQRARALKTPASA